MRDELSREVSRERMKAKHHLEPRGDLAGNGADGFVESVGSLGPNGQIGIENLNESDAPDGPDLATDSNLKDGVECGDESEFPCGPNGEIGIDMPGECEETPGPDLATNLKDNGADVPPESEGKGGPVDEIGIEYWSGSDFRDGPDLVTILADIGETSRRWRANVKARTRLTNQFEGKAKEAAVVRLRAAGKPLPEGRMPKPVTIDYAKVKEAYPEMVQAAALFDKPIARDVKIIERLVKMTSIAAWVKSVRGLGEMGAGHMLATGAPDKYPHYRMMVKALGIAPRAEYPLSKNGKHMVPGQRRGIMLYNVIDPLLRNNDGKYREIYDAERARQLRLHPEMDRGISKKTSKQQIAKYGDNVARMKVASVLISDLWQEWRAAINDVKARLVLPPSNSL